MSSQQRIDRQRDSKVHDFAMNSNVALVILMGLGGLRKVGYAERERERERGGCIIRIGISRLVG